MVVAELAVCAEESLAAGASVDPLSTTAAGASAAACEMEGVVSTLGTATAGTDVDAAVVDCAAGVLSLGVAGVGAG